MRGGKERVDNERREREGRVWETGNGRERVRDWKERRNSGRREREGRE